MKTTSVYAPQTIVKLNKNLVDVFRWERKLKKSEKLMKKAERKYGKDSHNFSKFIERKKDLESIYGWEKAKEAYRSSEEKDQTERPKLPNVLIGRIHN